MDSESEHIVAASKVPMLKPAVNYLHGVSAACIKVIMNGRVIKQRKGPTNYALMAYSSSSSDSEVSNDSTWSKSCLEIVKVLKSQYEQLLKRPMALHYCFSHKPKVNFSKYIFDSMVKNLDNAGKFLMYPRFIQVLLDNQLEGMATHNRIYISPSHTKKIFANMRRQRKDFSGRITPLFPTMVVQAQEEMGESSAMPTDPQHTPIITQPSSSQPQRKQKSRRLKRKDTEIPQSSVPSYPTNVADEVVNEGPSMQLNELMYFCTKLQQRVLDLENTKTAKRVKKLEKKGGLRTHKLKRLYKIGRSARVVSSEEANVEVTLVDESHGRHNDDLMFDTCVLNDEEVFARQDMAKKEVSTADLVTTAGEVVTTANVEVSIASPTTAKITNVELTLAHTLVELKNARPKTKGIVMQEPSESITTTTTIPSKDKGKGIMDKVKTDYELAQRLQAEEQEELTIEEISKLFQQLLKKRRKHFAAKSVEERRNRPPTKAQQRSIMVNTFVDMDTELVGGSEKQKMEDDKETSELQSMMEVILDEEEVAVDAIPLATKPPSIMLKSFDMEDLESLWKFLKAKHGYTRPEEGYERVLWGDLKTMFEHNIEDTVWRNLLGNKVLIWKLFDSCGVHFVRFQDMHIFMLVEKRYPLTPATITQMLNRKLQTDHCNEMCYQLLKLMTKQLKKQ
ncbi:hypothetical protein Tco_0664549 [Tanacetum coccineum]